MTKKNWQVRWLLKRRFPQMRAAPCATRDKAVAHFKRLVSSGYRVQLGYVTHPYGSSRGLFTIMANRKWLNGATVAVEETFTDTEVADELQQAIGA